MAILIEGMEMPIEKSRIIQIYPDGTVRRLDGSVFNNHFSAIPVPPHGDLIDRDALTHKIYSEIPFKVFKNVGRVSDMVLLVWDAPIILTDKDINVPIKEGEA